MRGLIYSQTARKDYEWPCRSQELKAGACPTIFNQEGSPLLSVRCLVFGRLRIDVILNAGL